MQYEAATRNHILEECFTLLYTVNFVPAAVIIMFQISKRDPLLGISVPF